jgi:hypothetical protein
MVERLRAKPGGPALPVTVGDMAEVAVPRAPIDPAGAPPRCRGVFVASNTFFGLPDEATQRRCLQGVARALAPGGFFLCAAFIPELTAPPAARGTVGVRSMTADQVVLTDDVHDDAAQTISGQFIDIRATGVVLRPFHIRYALPDQLDAMAADAGLRLAERWADWAGTPFDDHSGTHVSVYRSSGDAVS